MILQSPQSTQSHVNSIQRMLGQIECLIKSGMKSELEEKMVASLLSQLSERIKSNDETQKMRFKAIKDSQNVQFAELMYDKNDEIVKLQMQVNDLKKINSKDESVALKAEVSHLKQIIKERNNEIKRLTYKLVDVQSYTESLETSQRSNKKFGELQPDAEEIKKLFLCIKNALLSNQNILKLIHSKPNNSN